ncbi:hypothetical protein PFTANZ_00576 [Plasmodium falciparum Tanzania (2000708)]|uniref:Uncharacterized protein n=1 Tax=Plasmodium falciparum Tanzania (2000708) TaxID=1036725 RepID=A0A024WDT1_PLAFA|nr:hypothetical protein PFTANZ_00576 [Plasmodium falciparum Tanzania (2000708)]
MEFPVETIFNEEEIQNYEMEDVEITSMSKLSTEENMNYDIDERQEVRKELFSPYIKKTKDKKTENVKDFLALYKFVPQINEQVLRRQKVSILKKKLEGIYKFHFSNERMINILGTIFLLYIFLNKYFISCVKKDPYVLSYIINNDKCFRFLKNRTRRLYKGREKIKYEEVVTQKDISNINTVVLALLEYKKLYNNLNIPKNYILNVEDNESKQICSYINQIRMGDIDAKFHFIRRNILDYLMFDFKTPEFENKYINFTWRKLYLGIAWFIHTRGHPIVISPYDKIQFDVFPMDFCKPEEIQV